MKILDVCEFYAPEGGGVRTYVHAKLRAAARLGHEMVIVAPGPADSVADREGGRIVTVRAPRLPLDRRYHMFWDARRVHQILDAEQADLIEGSSPWRGGWAAATWDGDAPRALFMHLDPVSAFAYTHLDAFAPHDRIDRAFGWFWRYLGRLAAAYDTVICPSEGLARRLCASGIHHVRTVRMGVEANGFSPSCRSETLRAELLARCNLGPDATLLLGIGRHTPEKRWPVVLDAVRAVAASKPIGLLLIGAGHMTNDLLDRVAGDPHVHALEPIWDRALFATVMASADALVHGSAAETFGLVAAEALASGLPLVLPDAGAVADFAAPAWAETYNSGDAHSAAAAIMRLLNRPSAALRAAAAAAPRRTLDEHFDDLFAIYSRLVVARNVALAA